MFKNTRIYMFMILHSKTTPPMFFKLCSTKLIIYTMYLFINTNNFTFKFT